MFEAYEPVRQFEKAIAEYCGSKYGIAVESCTFALFLCCKYLKVKTVYIPKHTYQGVPCSIIHAGGKVKFTEEKWYGAYQLNPYPIYDSAIRFKKNMYIPKSYYCLSFQYYKHIPIGRGGMILTDDFKMAEWMKRARFDGRGEVPRHLDNLKMLGWNGYMTPEQAARGRVLFEYIKDKDLPDLTIDYLDLSKFKIYTDNDTY